MIEAYSKASGFYRSYDHPDPTYSGDLMHLDLNTVVPCVSGPKRPHDRVSVSNMKEDFNTCLSAPVGFKGFGLTPETLPDHSEFTLDGKKYSLTHGSVVIAAITSCTNTSNPDVMLAAGLLAKNAVERGLTV